MMNSRHPYGRDLASLSGNITSLHILYLLMNRSLAHQADTAGLLLWWGIGALTYGVDALLIHRLDRPSAAPVILGLSLILQLTAIRFLAVFPATLVGWLWLALIHGIPLFRTNELLLRPASDEQRLVDFETCLLTLIILTISVSTGTTPASSLLPASLSCLAVLWNLSIQHTAGRPGHHARGIGSVTLLLPLGIILICGLLFLPLMGQFSHLLHTFTQFLSGGIRRGAALISRLLMLLFSLFPAADEPVLLPEAAESVSGGDGYGAVLPEELVMTPLLVVFLAVGAAMILLGSRHHFQRKGTTGSTASRLPRRSLMDLIRSFLRSLREHLRFRWLRMVHRNTPEGVFCRIEAAMAHRGLRRLPSESPRAFLLRTADLFPDCREELLFLADRLDERYFSVGSTTESENRWKTLRRTLSSCGL